MGGTAGQALTKKSSTNYDATWQFEPPIFATAAERDAAIPAPVVGRTAMLAGSMQVYQGAAIGWTPPWNTSWGTIVKAEKTAVQGGITTIVDVTNMSVTWTAIAGRRYRTSIFATLAGQTVGDLIGGYMTDAANVVKQRAFFMAPTLSGAWWYAPFSVSVEETGLTGSVTRKFRLERNAGTGVGLGVYPDVAAPSYILVEDMGRV